MGGGRFKDRNELRGFVFSNASRHYLSGFTVSLFLLLRRLYENGTGGFGGTVHGAWLQLYLHVVRLVPVRRTQL